MQKLHNDGVMRTTIDLQDALLEQAKQEALMTGQRLSDVVNAIVQAHYTRLAQTPARSKLRKLPVWKGKGRGVVPGVDLESNASVRDAVSSDETYLHRMR